jgi:hypothetical protein
MEKVKNDRTPQQQSLFAHFLLLSKTKRNLIIFVFFSFSLFNFSINILVCLLSITKYHFPRQLILMIDSQTTHAGAFGLIVVHHVSLLTLNWLLSHLIFYCVSSLHSFSPFHLCCANAKYIFLPLHYFDIVVSLHTVHVFTFSSCLLRTHIDESLTCNVCDRAFKCHRQLASHQQKKRHFG